MKAITPVSARDTAAKLIPLFTGMAPSVLDGDELDSFKDASAAASAVCEMPATAANCNLIERQLGIMFKLFDQSAAFNEKPEEQVHTVVTCFEMAGSACADAALMYSLH